MADDTTSYAKFTVQLNYFATPEMKNELADTAKSLGISISEVLRGSVELGLPIYRAAADRENP